MKTKTSWDVFCSDVVIIDEDGYGKVVGRMKDLIIRGGENIYPVEVEQFLYKHPKIADVQVKTKQYKHRLLQYMCARVMHIKP